MDNLADLAGYIIIGIIALISWGFRAAKKSQQQQARQRGPVPQESKVDTPPLEQMPTGIQTAMQKLFGLEEHEQDEEPEEIAEPPEPEPKPEPAKAPEKESAPSAEASAEKESPEEIRKKIGEIMGMPLNSQNIRYGIIFSEILKRPTPRRLRN